MVNVIIPRPSQNGEQMSGVGKVFDQPVQHSNFGFLLALSFIKFLAFEFCLPGCVIHSSLLSSQAY